MLLFLASCRFAARGNFSRTAADFKGSKDKRSAKSSDCACRSSNQLHFVSRVDAEKTAGTEKKKQQVGNKIFFDIFFPYQVREILVSLPGSGATLLVYRLLDDAESTVKVAAAFRVPNKSLCIRSNFCPLAPASRDGTCVVSGGEGAEVLVFDVCRKKNALINTLQGHNAPVLDVAWSFDETLLASCDLTGLVIVWKRKEIEITE